MRDARLLFGPLGALVLLAGVIGLALLVPGYDPVRQTVSEIGETGSPMRIPFAAMLCTVAACLLVFTAGVLKFAKASGLPGWPALLIGATAVSAAGVGIFAFPHPLHNVFGLSELIGYSAPIAFALAWRGKQAGRSAAVMSGWMALLVWLAVAANLVSMFRDPVVWPQIKPLYGLVQRSLFAAWFAWAALLGVQLVGRRTA
jgi:hypothetical membrane protein